MSKMLGSQLRDMKILTDEGRRLGKISDVLINEDIEVEALVVEPESEEIIRSLPTDEDDNVLVPSSSVSAIKDYVVVSEKGLESSG